MEQYVKFVITFLCLWNLASSNPQHLVCKTMDDVFTEQDGSESFSGVRRLQGPPGKIGPRGIKGIPGVPGITGPPGAPAVVDYDRINQVVTEKVASVVAGIYSRITELERNFTELENATRLTGGNLCIANGGFLYRQNCYTIPPLTSSQDMNYNRAVTECAQTGALAAEIHDRTQQKELYYFASSKIPSGRSSLYLWVGMEYQSSTSTLLYRSGKRSASSQFHWLSGYPASSSSQKYLTLLVRNDDNSYFGLWNNYSPGNPLHGVICENQA